MGLVHDPEAAGRSLMMAQKSLCNGEKTGRVCAHYWAHCEKVESNNPDNLKFGQLFRVCMVFNAIAYEMGFDQLATVCNRYRPAHLPIWRQILIWLGLSKNPLGYNEEMEGYNPLTSAEIRTLQRGSSDPLVPLVRGRGGIPGSTSMADDSVYQLQLEMAEEKKKRAVALAAEKGIPLKDALQEVVGDVEADGLLDRANKLMAEKDISIEDALGEVIKETTFPAPEESVSFNEVFADDDAEGDGIFEKEEKGEDE